MCAFWCWRPWVWLSVYNTARVQAAKSNFLFYQLVSLYWLTPAEGKGHRLVPCFCRCRDVELTSEAMLGRCCCHSSSSHSAIFTCGSLRKKPVLIMNFGQSGSKVLSYPLCLPSGAFGQGILTTRQWLGHRGNTGSRELVLESFLWSACLSAQ